MSKVSVTIALAGKGGTGKTTLAVCLIRYLAEERGGSVLAIDADPAMNLPSGLGMQVPQTVGQIREDLRELVQASGSMATALPAGMSKHEYLDYQVKQALVEGDRVDLLAMGRPEGPGCYCAANQMLRLIIDRLSAHYDYVVIDNEAGMEHLSRRTTRDVDLLVLVSDPTQRGIMAAGEMAQMAAHLDIRVGKCYGVINRVRAELPEPLAKAMAQSGLAWLGTLPEDPVMMELEIHGRPILELPAQTPLYQKVRQMACQLLEDRHPLPTEHSTQ